MNQTDEKLQVTDVNVNDLPWIIFTLRGQDYAVSSALVAGIMQMLPITRVPNAPAVFEGVSNIRGEIVPIMDMRRLLGQPDFLKEQEETCQMLSQRIEDHKNWINALKHSIKTGEAFKLSLDPHQCAFGRWYYNYKSHSHSLNTMITQLEEPHAQFHENGKRILGCRDGMGGLSREGEELMKAEELLLESRIIRPINNIISSLRDDQNQMIITLSSNIGDQIPRLGIVVDTVVSVDKISLIDQRENSNCLFVSSYVYGVAHNDKVPGEILVLDEEKLLHLVNDFDASQKQDGDGKIQAGEEAGK